jgi:hypothetical protein
MRTPNPIHGGGVPATTNTRSLFGGGRGTATPSPAAAYPAPPHSAERFIPHMQAAWRGRATRSAMHDAVARRGAGKSPQDAVAGWHAAQQQQQAQRHLRREARRVQLEEQRAMERGDAVARIPDLVVIFGGGGGGGKPLLLPHAQPYPHARSSSWTAARFVKEMSGQELVAGGGGGSGGSGGGGGGGGGAHGLPRTRSARALSGGAVELRRVTSQSWQSLTGAPARRKAVFRSSHCYEGAGARPEGVEAELLSDFARFSGQLREPPQALGELRALTVRTAEEYRRVVCQAVAQRLERSCGLSVTLMESDGAGGGDSIICGVTADASDLLTECMRSRYLLQMMNEPLGIPGPAKRAAVQPPPPPQQQEQEEGGSGQASEQQALQADEKLHAELEAEEQRFRQQAREGGCTCDPRGTKQQGGDCPWCNAAGPSANNAHGVNCTKCHNAWLEQSNAQRGTECRLLRQRMDKTRPADAVHFEPPVIDPILKAHAVNDDQHRELRRWMSRSGHREVNASHSSGAGVYLAPYAALPLTDDVGDEAWRSLLPLFRCFDGCVRHSSPHERGACVFKAIDRTRLVRALINHHIDLPYLFSLSHVGSTFALHDKREKAWLRGHWVSWYASSPLRCLDQPLGRIRNYFGEAIALYFAWLQHYTRALVYPTVIGALVTVGGWLFSEDPNNWVAGEYAFSFFLMCWSCVFLQRWKQRNAFLNLWWGTSDMSQHETEREEFDGVARRRVENDTMHQAQRDRRGYSRRRAIGGNFALVAVLGAIAVVSIIFVMKNRMVEGCVTDADDEDDGAEFTRCVARVEQLVGVANALQIMGLNFLYRSAAKAMTRFENHRTDSAFENSLIGKTFLFQFVNSFSSFFYIAFVKQKFTSDVCLENSCMTELQRHLASLFLTRITVGNAIEVGPKLWQYCRRKRTTTGEPTLSEPPAPSQPSLCRWAYPPAPDLTAAALTKHNADAHEIKTQASLGVRHEIDAIDDYAEMVIQFGFVTLFVVAFPLAPLCAFVNNVFELHIDAWKVSSSSSARQRNRDHACSTHAADLPPLPPSPPRVHRRSGFSDQRHGPQTTSAPGNTF